MCSLNPSEARFFRPLGRAGTGSWLIEGGGSCTPGHATRVGVERAEGAEGSGVYVLAAGVVLPHHLTMRFLKWCIMARTGVVQYAHTGLGL